MSTPTIALLHATRGRPKQADGARYKWLSRAQNYNSIEHIFAIDEDDAESIAALSSFSHIIVPAGGGCVRAWNAALAATTAPVIVQLSDDWTPQKGWDTKILARIGDVRKPAVLAISDGHRTDKLLCMAICTRAYTALDGWLFHPEFTGVFSDNYFTEQAYKRGVVIEARDLVFTHNHPAFGTAPMDATYAAQNARHRYEEGAATLARLHAAEQAKNRANRPKITCFILTYNEGERIGCALSHAMKWADEVLVVDKSSTDNTRQIAEAAGATVKTIPFSRQGHEDVPSLIRMATHDWVWGFTPGEVPTKALIDIARGVIGDGEWIDLIQIPIRMYSFGVHSPHSPWGLSVQNRLFHKGRVTITADVHNNISARPERTRAIPHAPDCYVLHQTHATAADFMRSHTDYMVAEAMKKDLQAVHNAALQTAAAYAGNFSADPALAKQALAWQIYWLGVALHCREKHEGKDVPAEYKARREALAKQERHV